MTTPPRSAADDVTADAEYITAVRGGDRSAFGPLYKRHQAAAYHLARQLVTSPSEAEDLVSESFAKVFNTLLGGGGPDSAFRAYLLTSVRNTFYDAVRQGKKLSYTDNLEPLDPGEEFEDPAVKGLDNELAAKAFATLPERWQTVLWHTEIEGESPAQVAPLLGLTANGVAALAYRAREGLKQAFLQAHVADVAADDCKVTSGRLGAWSRGGLSKREQAQVDKHLEVCDRCAAVAAEISDLGTGLRGVVAVVAIGTPTLTAAYLAGGSMAKIGALAWAGATAPAAGLAKIAGLVGGVGTLTPGIVTGASGATAATSTAATTAAGVFVESSSSSAAAAGAAAHSSKGLWGAVAGTAAVAAIATVVIVSANFGDPEPSADDSALAPPTSQEAQPPSSPGPSTSDEPTTSEPEKSDPAESDESDFDLDNSDLFEGLPPIPAVEDDDLLGDLPSIEALPDEDEDEDADEDGEEADEEAPADEDEAPPATEEPPYTDPGDEEPPVTDPGEDPGDEDPGDEEPPVTDPEEPPAEPEPGNPEPNPTEIDLVLDEDGTYTSGSIGVTNSGEVAYESFTVTIVQFPVTNAEGDETATPGNPAVCTVIVDGTAENSFTCGGEIADSIVLSQASLEAINSEAGATVEISIDPIADGDVIASETVTATFTGTIGGTDYNNSATLTVPQDETTDPDEGDEPGETGDPAEQPGTEEGTTNGPAGEPASGDDEASVAPTGGTDPEATTQQETSGEPA